MVYLKIFSILSIITNCIKKFLADNENKFNANFSTGILKKLHIAQHSVKTYTEEKNKEPIEIQNKNAEYKNNQEDFSTIEKLEQKTDNNHKQKAQHFLLDQIKSGWPYDDRYYHTES